MLFLRIFGVDVRMDARLHGNDKGIGITWSFPRKREAITNKTSGFQDK